MAELILTDAERAAALWSDLDDEALGRLVRKKMIEIAGAAAQLDRLTTFAAGLLVCCGAAEAHTDEITFNFDSVTQAGRAFGDWRVVATKRRGHREDPPQEAGVSLEHKALEVLEVLARAVADGKSYTFSEDWGYATATLIDAEGAHTHVGQDFGEDERAKLASFVNGVHQHLVHGCGLTWAKALPDASRSADDEVN